MKRVGKKRKEWDLSLLDPKHRGYRWILILASAILSVGLLVLLGVSVALILLLITIFLVWLALIPEYVELQVIQKRKFLFGLAGITTVVILISYIIQSCESSALKQDLAAAGPRTLSERQSKEWVNTLLAHSGTSVSVIANGPTTESIDLSRQFEKVLRDAGWDVRWDRFWHQHSKGSFTSGIEIILEYPEGDPNGIMEPAKTLYKLVHREFPVSRLIENISNNERIQVYIFPKP